MSRSSQFLASEETPDLNFRQTMLRLGLVLVVLCIGFYIVGASGSSSLRPRLVLHYLFTSTPAAISSYASYYFYNVLEKYDFWGVVASVGFLMIIGIATALLVFEIFYYWWKRGDFRVGMRETSLYRFAFGDKSERTDLYLFLYYALSLDGLVVMALGLLGPFIIFGILVNNVQIGIGQYMPSWAAFLVFILVADFLAYWFHRFAHTTTSLWELHKFHHSALSMNLLTAHRNHPFEVAMQYPLRAIPLILVGPSIPEYVVYTMIHHAVILLQHSNFNVGFGWFGRIIVSPRFHLLHHSSKPEHFDQNYAVVFSFWDDLFGTRYKGKDIDPVYGVTDNYFNRRGFGFDMWAPFKRFWRGIFRKPVKV